jgi:hypothetical protein
MVYYTIDKKLTDNENVELQSKFNELLSGIKISGISIDFVKNNSLVSIEILETESEESKVSIEEKKEFIEHCLEFFFLMPKISLNK